MFSAKSQQSLEELLALECFDSVPLIEDALLCKESSGHELLGVEMNILAVCAFEREVNNGGLQQFFTNSSVQYTPIIVEALKKIGCLECSKLAQRAVDVLDVEDLDNLEEIDERIDGDEALSDAFDKLDDVFYSYEESIVENLHEYIKKNQADISLISPKLSFFDTIMKRMFS